MQRMGIFLIVVSIIFWFFSVRMDITEMNFSFEIVKSSHLMQKQIIYTNAAGILFLAGIFFLGLGSLGDLLNERLTKINNSLDKTEQTENKKS